MIKNGFKDCAFILVPAALIGAVSGYFAGAEIGIYGGSFIFMFGGVYMGTKYRKKYGPLLFSEDGKPIRRLFLYSVGYGVLAGFPVMFFSQYFVERVNIYISIFLAITAIPLFGMSMIGAFALGRLLNRNLDE